MTDFPKTLGEVSFVKLVNYLGERKPFFSIKRKLLRVSQFVSYSQPFLATTKGDAPLESPNLYFYYHKVLTGEKN